MGWHMAATATSKTPRQTAEVKAILFVYQNMRPRPLIRSAVYESIFHDHPVVIFVPRRRNFMRGYAKISLRSGRAERERDPEFGTWLNARGGRGKNKT